MNRRAFLWRAPLSVGLLVGCSPAARRSTAGARYLEIESRAAERKQKIVVFMPETVQTRHVWQGLCDELGQDFGLFAVRIDGRDAVPIIREALARHQPSALVLMNNPTLAAYREYQRSSGLAHFPPAVIVMTSFLEGGRHQVRATTGISYEVPLITGVTNLRKLIDAPIERVGVVMREPLAGFVQRQSALAEREQVVVTPEYVSSKPNSSEIKRALRRLKQRAGAIWVLNDDHLLTPSLIADGWLPGLNERPWVPSIVGAASLVSPAQSFGTFAVVPDHTALGVQAAGLLFDIAGNDWILPEEGRVDLPLSTTTSLDLAQARERFSLRGNALQQVDQILE